MKKIAIIQLKSTEEITHQLISGMMKALEPLPAYFSKEILIRLRNIAAGKDMEEQRIDHALRKLQREEWWQKIFPWLALFVTLFVCIAMYFFAKK
jgi:hypothetical protein